MSEAQAYDVAIVGGGPAGAAAAIATRAFGLEVCLIDEQPRFGGQIYRQPPVGFRVDSWLAGKAYAQGRALIARAEQLSGLHHIASATVWGIFPVSPEGSASGGHHVLFYNSAGLGRVRARHILLASGCYEMPVPFPGWHLPGVMSAGGIQTLLKSQRIAAATNIVLAGSHPLLLTVAEQILAAGVRVAAVSFTQPLSTALRLLRSPLATWSASGLMLQTLKVLATLRRARIPVMFGSTVVEALGDNALKSVRLQSSVSGSDTLVRCDGLGVCYGFLASSELARQAGARHSWDDGSGWIVHTDDFMRTSVPGLSVAGEQTGVAGAEAAALSGEIAGLGIAVDVGRLSTAEAKNLARNQMKRLTAVRRFAALLADLATPPVAALDNLAGRTTILCRCEDVTVGALSDALVADPAIASASTAKLLTRVGMGICQGRMCEVSVRRLIAQQRGCRVADVPGYTARPPVKPIPISLLASDRGALDIDPTKPASWLLRPRQ